MAGLALEGIRVLDFSRLAPGPYCSMLLGDMGADVLLVEAPAGAVKGNFPAGNASAGERERRRAHNALSRNKRSIVVNLKEQAGRDLIYRLAGDVDVVLEGFRPGVVDRLGVGYEQLSEINPRIVYCSLSGYGQTGPYREMVGHDINYISIGGALGMIGPGEGQKPSIPANIIADFAGGGLMSAFAIVTALMARERTGRGQYVDSSMSDGVLYLLASATGGVLAGGASPKPGEVGLGGGSPHYGTYECADGKYISLGSLEPHFWAALVNALGRPEYEPLEYDRSRYDEIRASFAEEFRKKTRDEWFEQLRGIDICVAPVLSLEEALADEHQLARDMLVEVEDPAVGTVRQVGVGPKLSETPGSVRSTAPSAGQHTDEVLSAAGYSTDEIASLRGDGVVV
jgi:crotonobetainyl-CoA:carnitine CoA-transferase CaiB-like acyl-CoA transferase